MEVRILRYFLAVAREENITKAAEILHITQPTLSRQLNQLEEEVGVRLFERGSRKIVLTNEGLLLCRRAEEIISLVDKTERELIVQEEVLEGTISIGCGELQAVQVLPELFRSFSEKYPQVNYDLFTANADQVKEQMEAGIWSGFLLLWRGVLMSRMNLPIGLEVDSKIFISYLKATFLLMRLLWSRTAWDTL